jgi:hypothetical protein
MSIHNRLKALERAAAAAPPPDDPGPRLSYDELLKLPPEELQRRHRRALGLDCPVGAVGPRPDPAEEERLRMLSVEELHRLHRRALGHDDP